MKRLRVPISVKSDESIARRALFTLLVIVALGVADGAAQERPRVLITNDNGIDDERIHVLARAFSKVADTFVVASSTDRSGSSNYMAAVRAGKFRVQPRDLGPGITAYALDGTPADCVIFALTGLMKDAPPDLVVSGINGGPNLADDWFGSGTIGAARTAAYFGVRAIAVSGSASDPHAMQSVADWAVTFARSPAVQGLKPPQYLTVSFPVIASAEIKGVRVVSRARGVTRGESNRSGEQGGWQEWSLSLSADPASAGPESDLAAVSQGFIAIVAMQADESAPALADSLRRDSSGIPAWKPAAPSAGECRPLFGANINGAEEPSGREWGVLIVSLVAGGPAAKAAFQAGDVITAVDGRSMASGRGEPNPDRKFVELLRTLCGKQARFTVRRGNQDVVITMSF